MSARKEKDWVRQAVELDAQGWTLTPIADKLGVKRSTVYGALVRARGKGIKHRKFKPKAPDGASGDHA